MVNPIMVWSRIGIKIVCKEFSAPENLSAEKQMAPQVVINLWIGEKIEDGGDNKNG